MNKTIKHIIAIFLAIVNLLIILDFYQGIIAYMHGNIILCTIILFGITDFTSFICICYVIDELMFTEEEK